MRNLFRATALLIALPGLALAAERRDPTEIDSVALTTQTQQMSNDANTLDLVWWIPVEFWEAAFRQDPSLPASEADAILDAMRPYFLVVVIQADISPFGNFTFLPESAVADGLRVTYVDNRGQRLKLDRLQTTNPDFESLLSFIRPLLANAMGNMGQNFHFYAYSAEDENGNRIASPYEEGVMTVNLSAREDAEPSVFEFEAPLDALFVPRMCPNGKPAHISWNYCPWDGSRLGR